MRKMLKIDLAKHGLNKTWDLRQIWSHFGRPNRREERREEKREEEEENKMIREEERRRSQDKKGM